MKLAIWDILAVLILVLLCIMGVIFAQIFANPYSAINPFPPPTMPATIAIPSYTPTRPMFPGMETPTPGGGTPEAMISATPGEGTITTTPGPGTPYVIPTWTATTTFTPTPSVTGTSFIKTSTPPGGILRTYTATAGPSPTKAPTSTATAPPNISGVIEVSGTKSGVWQKKNSSPVFRWKVTMDMFDYFWYFGPREDGGEDGNDIHQVAIQHDARYVELAPPIQTTCGVYYLRVKTRYAIKPKPGNPVEYMSSLWDTVFVFKYDAQPPIPPYFAAIGISGATRGIQNVSGSPKFTWSWIDGVPGSTMGSASAYAAGDYIPWDVNADGTDEIYLCSGIKGYYVFWGKDPNGVDKKRFIQGSNFAPGSVPANTSYYLRIAAVDKLDNMSEWRTVALDEDYEPSPWPNPPPPTLEQSVFYYDKVRPNNITDILANDSLGNPISSGDIWRRDSYPSFEFVGGYDPVGWNGTLLKGYQVVWNTLMNEKFDFQSSRFFNPTVTKSGTYYLRVRAVDYAGNTAVDWYTFIYKFDNVGPTSITNVTETHGYTSGKWYTSVSDPEFRFNANVKDPGDRTTSSGIVPDIWLYFGTDPSSTPVDSLGGIGGTRTSPTFPVAGDGVYYFRARTMDNAGNETISTPFVLKVDGTAPTLPTRTIEKNGAQDGVGQSKVSSPTFNWTGAEDTTSGIKGYYVYFGTNASAEPSNATLRTSSTFSPGKVAKGTYYLRLRVADNAGNLSPWETIFTFIYQ